MSLVLRTRILLSKSHRMPQLSEELHRFAPLKPHFLSEAVIWICSSPVRTVLADVQLHGTLAWYFIWRFQCKEIRLVRENEKIYLFSETLDAFLTICVTVQCASYFCPENKPNAILAPVRVAHNEKISHLMPLLVIDSSTILLQNNKNCCCQPTFSQVEGSLLWASS